ncbi:MAG: hypothetical protein AAGE86_15110 [Pseudomonadota bacterium]
MFEKVLSESIDRDTDCVPGDLLIGSRDTVTGRGGDALRAIEWSELTARLNAARDLRRVLRRDVRHSIESTAASFGDAAATYFQTLGNSEQGVNPVALEASKASQGIVVLSTSEADGGDARDDT